MPAVDGVGVADDRDGAQLAHGALRLGDRGGHVVEGELGGELEPARVDGAEIARPVVVGAREGGRYRGVEIVVHQHLAAARAVDHRDVDALDVHGLEMGRRVVAARVRHRVVGMTGEGALLQAPAHHRGARPLRHLGDLHLADLDDGLVGRALRGPGEAGREFPERLLQVLLPEAVRLHGVQVAVEDTESVFHGRLLRNVESWL